MRKSLMFAAGLMAGMAATGGAQASEGNTLPICATAPTVDLHWMEKDDRGPSFLWLMADEVPGTTSATWYRGGQAVDYDRPGGGIAYDASFDPANPLVQVVISTPAGIVCGCWKGVGGKTDDHRCDADETPAGSGADPEPTPAPAPAPVVQSAPVPAPAPVPVVAPAPAPVIAAPTAPRLRISKSATRSVMSGRTYRYRIVVRNTGDATARKVKVADRLPGGVVLRKIPKGARLKGGQLVWNISSLAPNERRVLVVPVRAVRTSGRVCNLAVTRASNHRTLVRDRACTTIRKAPRRALRPAVTG